MDPHFRAMVSVAAVFAVLSAAAPSAQAKQYVFTDITAPGAPASDYAFAGAINDKGQVLVGAANSVTSFDFIDVNAVYDIHSHSYAALSSYPGADPLSTETQGINNAGQMVGGYHPSGGQFQGFLYSGGVFTSVDAFGDPASEATKISNAGEIVGYAGHDAYSLAGGVFTKLDPVSPTFAANFAIGVNTGGDVLVGATDLASGATSSWLKHRAEKWVPVFRKNDAKS